MIAEVPLVQSANDENEEIIADLRKKLSHSEEERTLIRERLNEIEREFCNMLNDQQTNSGAYEQTIENLMRERDALLEELEPLKRDSEQK